MFGTYSRPSRVGRRPRPDRGDVAGKRFGWPGWRRGCTRAMWSLVHLALVFGLSVASYFFFSRFVYTTVEVRGLSMYPNLVPGDRFVLNLWWYALRDPHRGDLVVLRDPVHGDFAVKRVIGLPREQVQMRKHIAYVDGQRLVEPYLPASALASEDAMMERGLVVPSGCYFVLGDNRVNSEDSRRYGAVPRQNILGTIRLPGQLQAFLRPAFGEVVDQAGLLPLPRISAAASETKGQVGP